MCGGEAVTTAFPTPPRAQANVLVRPTKVTVMSTWVGSGRTAASVIIVTTALLASSCSLVDSSPSAAMVVPVPHDETVTVEVDENWSVTVPAGATGTADAELTVSQVAVQPQVSGAETRAIADFALSTGQPLIPLTFTYQLDEPLPPDRILYLLDDDANGNDFLGEPDEAAPLSSTRVHLAEMSPDRLTATVRDVEHLSWKSWIGDGISALTNSVGKLLNQRFDAPDCEGQPPGWLDDAVFVDDVNAPMLVCTGVDPTDAEIAVVKVTNNRGTGLVITSPVVPTWAYQTIIGSEIESWAPDLLTFALGRFGVSADAINRTYVLPPGQSVHLGFTRDRFDDDAPPAAILGSVTPEAAAFGVVTQLLGEAFNDPNQLSVYELGLLAVCVRDGATGISAELASTVVAIGKIAGCAIGDASTVVDVLIDVLPADVWARIGGQVVSGARLAKKILARYGAVAGSGFIAADFATTFAFSPAVLTVSLFYSQRGPAVGGPPKVNLDALWARWRELNDTCRGGPPPGVDEDVDMACTERDEIMEEHATKSAAALLTAWKARDEDAVLNLVIPEARDTFRQSLLNTLMSFTPAETAFDCRYDVELTGTFGCFIGVSELPTSLYFSWDTDIDRGWLLRAYAPDA